MSEERKKRLRWISEGPRLQGRKELEMFRDGKRLTRQQTIKAMCYRCTDGWDLGKGCKVVDCPAIVYCPYQPKG